MSKSGTWWVAVEVPLRRSFLYEVPEQLNEPAPGTRVVVPFGRRKVAGYLIEPAGDQPDKSFAIKKVAAVDPDGPSFSEEMLKFLDEAANYYMHPKGEVLRNALPPGIEALGVLRDRRGSAAGKRIERVVSACEGAKAALDEISKRAPVRAALLQRIADSDGVTIEDLKRSNKRASALVRQLVESGLVSVEERERPPDPFFSSAVERDVPPILAREQTAAVKGIEARIEQGGYEGFLLHGITGSGKTEVYLHAIAKARSLGRGALVLVPEISLTPQLIQRYRARFGDELSVLHSGLSDRERFEQWKRLKKGEVRVAVGVRSAVFAPVGDLGIIVVDEEHDPSFKQERGFPYNARDMALLRASRAGAAAVLGSATPSLESFHNVELGKLTCFELPSRALDRPLPEVEIVDLARHRSGPGGQNAISAPLYEAIAKTLGKKEQAILFLNRRGFSPSLRCDSCGFIPGCDACAVSLTFHRYPAGMVCHYCGARHPVPKVCASCSSDEIKPLGAGTQKIEDLIARLFPEARIARLDRDVASGRRAEEVLNQIGRGDIDILIGTQMVTKGHDFPKVTLVGVLLADVGLHMPDFRAPERTFQLLTQVAGRAGRAELKGKAIIQTYSPGHPSVEFAKNHDYAAFAAEELAARKELGYPPFGRLAALRLSGPDRGRVEAAARDLAKAAKSAWERSGRPKISLLGPAPAPISQVKGRYRWQLLLRSQRQDRIRQILSPLIGTIEDPPSGVRIRLDIDPVSML